jgi:eukaryotic-like serine/threonine-protein kinase
MKIHSSEPPRSRNAGMLPPGTILQSRYRILKRIGEGGMGAVYEAMDLRLDYTVAIKQILTTKEEFWKQFEREAQMLARLTHPALPRVSDYFTEGNRAFFVMQFIEGSDLADMMSQQARPFPRHQVIAWADQLLDALVYLHSNERQIIHRDIKPHNLKVSRAGQISLLDFGLAKGRVALLASDDTAHSVFGYSPRYAPLEQVQNLGTGPQSDIYALGATLYHLLTGVKPPDAVTRAAALVAARSNALRPADEVNPAVGAELSAILDCAMSQNAADRYPSAQEFRSALRQLGRVNDHDETRLAVARFDDSSARVINEIVAGEIRPQQKHFGRMIGALILVLLTAFGVFCRYYPWKLPAAESRMTAEPSQPNLESQSGEIKRSDVQRDYQKQ